MGRFVEKFMAYVNRLVKEGVVPVMVFDGKLPPIKNDEAARRKQYVAHHSISG